MADYSREIARQLEKLVAEQHETNKRLKKIEDALIEKQFSDWVAPPRGSVYQNLKGCTMLNSIDFDEIYSEYLAKGEGDEEK